MVNHNGPIGLLDSGVGGLTVAREIFNYLPEEEIVYYGDTLHLPYGPRLLSEVREFVINIIDYFIIEKKVKAVVLACNTATSAALKMVQKRYQIPIFGMIDAATRRARQITKNKKIGVIGTEGTINSQAYQRSLMADDHSLEVFSAACPEFVELVEAGKFTGQEVENYAHKYLDGLIDVEVDVLILGCTHFPYLIPVLQKVMGEQVQLVNPAVEMAREVRSTLEERKMLKKAKNQQNKISGQQFLVSDISRISQQFLEEGSKFLGLPNLEFKEKNIFV